MKVRKEDIVTAARELFREKGYAGASMQDLADRVGLRKASLYMRFPSKEALVPDVLAATLRETCRSPADEGGWEAAYAAQVRAIAADLKARRRCVGFHLAYGIGDDTPVAKAAVEGFFRSLRDRLAVILADAMPRRTAEVVAADALVRLEGATLLLALFDEGRAMDRAVDAVLAEARQAARRGENSAE